MIWELLEALKHPQLWAIKFERGEIFLAPLDTVQGHVIERQLVK